MLSQSSIVLSTFGSLVRQGYDMSVHCWRCEWSVTTRSGSPKLSQLVEKFPG